MAATLDARTPVTMLSGFLGSGKTTLLRYLLENTTERIACIVNDVAAINIDAKLIRNRRSAGDDTSKNTTSDLTDTIELQNGCACCTVQDELFQSFEQLLALGERNGKPYQRIVLENSGVAEPHNLRELFNAAIEMGNPIVQKVRLCTMVTVVDSSSFIKEYASRAPVMARPDLGEGGTMRPVVDLLVEQIECADILILNKTDLLAAGSIEQLEAIVTSLNPLAKVYRAQHSKVPLDEVFGSQASQLVAQLNVEGQHRGAVVAARALESLHEGGNTAERPAGGQLKAGGGAGHHGGHNDHDHGHGQHHHHDHGHGQHHHHDHGHGQHHHHDHGHGQHHHHDHGHGQHHHHDLGHGQHHHEHQHDHGDRHDCTECKHGHHTHDHHHHSHAVRQETTAAKRFGIRNFVYTRRRPFHPQRLRQLVLRWLPVSSNAAASPEEMPAASLESPVRTVLRSKGFVWMSNSHTTAYYWSHAGQHFEIRDEGDWWVSVPEEEWPADESQCRVILADFDLHTTCGDRRQELVFIGPNMDRAAITKQLDGALLTDEEFVKYEENYASQKDPVHARYQQLRAKHANDSQAGASN